MTIYVVSFKLNKSQIDFKKNSNTYNEILYNL